LDYGGEGSKGLGGHSAKEHPFQRLILHKGSFKNKAIFRRLPDDQSSTLENVEMPTPAKERANQG
jgi:hypothetical protein